MRLRSWKQLTDTERRGITDGLLLLGVVAIIIGIAALMIIFPEITFLLIGGIICAIFLFQALSCVFTTFILPWID